MPQKPDPDLPYTNLNRPCIYTDKGHEWSRRRRCPCHDLVDQPLLWYRLMDDMWELFVVAKPTHVTYVPSTPGRRISGVNFFFLFVFLGVVIFP